MRSRAAYLGKSCTEIRDGFDMKKSRGFTLIELMIVVAVIAILAAIAYPSYQESISKSRRSDAQAALQGLAQAMERFYTSNGTYDGAATGGATTGAPAVFATKSPIDGSQTFYNLTISAAAANSYTLLASPVGGQADDGLLGLQSTGLRGWSRDGDNDPFEAGEQCWETSCS